MEALRFALLGLASGGVYALLAQGIVLIYRGSGLLNFAQGAFAMFGAFGYYELTMRDGLPKVIGAVVAVGLCAVLGAAFHLFALQRMRNANASPLSRVIATLSLLLILQSAALLIYGSYPLTIPSLLPTRTVHVFTNKLPVTEDRLYILGICLVISTMLYIIYRWAPFGRVTAAVAENELAAASFGYAPDTVAAINWAVGSALAGVAGILIAPIIFLEPNGLVLLVIPAMTVALVAGFSSFVVALVAALALGMIQSELTRYVSEQGWATAAPFVIVIALLVLRGQALPLRSFILDRRPAVGTGRARPLVIVALCVAAGLATSRADADWNVAMVTTFGMGIICLSIVLLTGFAGQLSLAQYVIAGVGALLAARLSSAMPFIPTFVLAGLLTGVIGALIGLPALRTRGVTLAVATLCLGSGVVAVVFSNSHWTGGLSGIVVRPPSLFGWSIDPLTHSGRYAFVTIMVLLGLCVLVANLRRGATGRRLLAVRSNERAAASLGVAVAEVKVYAFFVAAVIAAFGGILLAFVQPAVQVSQFDVFTCIVLVGVTVTAGIGFLPGAVLGGALVTGGILTVAFSGWQNFNLYLPLIGAVLLLLTLIVAPDGSFAMARRMLDPALRSIDRVLERTTSPLKQRRNRAGPSAGADNVDIAIKHLYVRDLSVSFGGVKAVQAVSFDVRPGEIHGLIGPNGAGKTTVIDAITGFARMKSGSVTLGDDDISAWSPRRRAIGGVSRSFQSLELFDDLTVEENIAIASGRRQLWRYLTDAVWPGHIQLNPAARAAVRGFQLDELLTVRPASISFGQRKLVAIARCVASAPSILLLDEPAAGLDDAEADELAILIRRLADEWNIGILLVEHKVDMIMTVCDRITVLESGKVLASGEPDLIRSTASVLEAYLGVAEPVAAAAAAPVPAPVAIGGF